MSTDHSADYCNNPAPHRDTSADAPPIIGRNGFGDIVRVAMQPEAEAPVPPFTRDNVDPLEWRPANVRDIPQIVNQCRIECGRLEARAMDLSKEYSADRVRLKELRDEVEKAEMNKHELGEMVANRNDLYKAAAGVGDALQAELNEARHARDTAIARSNTLDVENAQLQKDMVNLRKRLDDIGPFSLHAQIKALEQRIDNQKETIGRMRVERDEARKNTDELGNTNIRLTQARDKLNGENRRLVEIERAARVLVADRDMAELKDALGLRLTP